MWFVPQTAFGCQVELLRVEYLECGAQALGLQFAPQLALVAAHTVHDSGYIPELLLVIILELNGGDAAAKERILIEVRLEGSDAKKTVKLVRIYLVNVFNTHSMTDSMSCMASLTSSSSSAMPV